MHPCHAGLCDTSYQIARESGAQVIEQNKILQYIDFDKLKSLEILPPDYVAKGTKGLTTYTAMLGIEAQNLMGGKIAFMDTDIANPGPCNGYGTESDYMPLDYLALPFIDDTQDPSQISAIFTARGGDGRNNHSVKGELMRHLVNSSDPYLRCVAWNMVKRTWLLSGEFIINGDLLANMPWPTDMGIEIMAAVHTSGYELEQGVASVCQVANPTNKDTRDESDEEREYGSIIYPVQTALQSANQMIAWTDRPPHLWDHEDVALYNMHFAGQRKMAVVMNNHLHGQQRMRSYTTGFMMPSIKMMQDLDVVDFDGIRRMSQGVNQTNFYL